MDQNCVKMTAGLGSKDHISPNQLPKKKRYFDLLGRNARLLEADFSGVFFLREVEPHLGEVTFGPSLEAPLLDYAATFFLQKESSY